MTLSLFDFSYCRRTPPLLESKSPLTPLTVCPTHACRLTDLVKPAGVRAAQGLILANNPTTQPRDVSAPKMGMCLFTWPHLSPGLLDYRLPPSHVVARLWYRIGDMWWKWKTLGSCPAWRSVVWWPYVISHDPPLPSRCRPRVSSLSTSAATEGPLAKARLVVTDLGADPEFVRESVATFLQQIVTFAAARSEKDELSIMGGT